MTDEIKRIQIEGKEILLVPTAHVSQKSVELVKQVIEEEKPDSVCIELDKKRFANMKNPGKWEDTDLVTVIKAKQIGFMVINLVLASYQKKMAEKLGSTPGAEMKQAVESAEKCGAKVVLADRDIQVTFLRTWRKLGLKGKFKLLMSVFFSFDDEEDEEELDELAIAAMLEGDVLEGMIADIDEELPQLGEVLIHERDRYLSDKIKKAPGDKVLAVLGAAHVPGILQEIGKDYDVTELEYIPPGKPIGKVIAWGIPLLILALIVYSFVSSMQTGFEQLGSWVFWHSLLSGLFTIAALPHPLAVLCSFLLSPFTALNPAVAVGWFSGLIQAMVMKPKVKDLETVGEDVFSIKGWYRNKVLKVLLVIILANIGSSLGTFIAGADIITNLFV